ncbi:G_PROTEIN_RECEP_F3_4 domain-containing protein, partial [Durusdinium trenchii]
AMTLKLSQVKLLLDSSSVPVEATPASVAFGVMENGLQFGDNGDPVSRLTADIHNARSPLAWPISGYTYIVVRKNTTRFGGDCRNRVQTFKYSEWLCSEAVVEEIAASHGFAELPFGVRSFVLDKIRTQFLCNGEPIFQEPKTFETVVQVNPALRPLIQLILRLCRSVNDLTAFTFDEQTGKVIKTDLVARMDTPTLTINFARNVPMTSDSTHAVRLFQIPMTVAFSLCGNEEDCAFHGVDVSVTVKTLARILDGSIGFWDDPLIKATKDESTVSLPHEEIAVFRTSDAAERAWDVELEFIRRDTEFGGYFAQTDTAASFLDAA